MSHRWLSVCVLVSLVVFRVLPAWSSEELKLPEIRIEELTPVETLTRDEILPDLNGPTKLQSSSGSVENSLFTGIPLPTNNYGQPGQLTQFRGAGRSVTETQVQALGISLNPAQGGGLDLSTLPQYLWSDFRYQMGPALGAFDLRASSGTLILRPWTDVMLDEQGTSSRATFLASGAGITQTSVGFDQGDQAMVAGWSTGKALGPSGSMSSRWSVGGIHGKWHLLASQIKTDVPGPLSYQTPQQTQVSTRILPLIQADLPLGGPEAGVLKTSLFYDAQNLDNDDPGTYNVTPGLSQSRSRTRQAGGDLAWLKGAWKLGVGARNTRYTLGSIDPYSGQTSVDQSENSYRVSASADFQVGAWTLNPMVQAEGLTLYGTRPGASFGARYAITRGDAAFARLTYSNTFPGLLDRYYCVAFSYPGNVCNPNLQVERDWTLVTGLETQAQATQASLQLMGQVRDSAVVRSTGYAEPSNVGRALVGTAVLSVEHQPLPQWNLVEKASLSRSRVIDTDQRFPYIPEFTNVFGVEWRQGSDDPAYRVRGTYRRTTPVSVTSNDDQLPGYGYFELYGSYRVLGGAAKGPLRIDLTAQVENLADTPITYYKDYPPSRRNVTGGLVARF